MFKKIFALASLCLSLASQADVIAGIELGSKGIKAIAIDLGNPEGSEQQGYKIVFREDIRADTIEGASNGLLQEGKIAETANAVAVLFNKLKRFDPQLFTVVGSTSFDNYDNRPALENAIYEKIKKKPVFITNDEEIFYALKASVKAKYAPRSILIDVGSGNTKLGYVSPMSANGFESTRFEYGTKSLSAKAAATPGSYGDALRKIIQSEVIPAVRAAIQKQPGIASVQRKIYIEGGASWAVASYAQPSNIDKPYTYLKASEVETVANRFERNDLQVKTNSDKESDTFLKVLDNFDQRQLMAGSMLLKSVLNEINADKRQIVFNRNGGWIIGYLITKYKGLDE